jgi:hypothetical protein
MGEKKRGEESTKKKGTMRKIGKIRNQKMGEEMKGRD